MAHKKIKVKWLLLLIVSIVLILSGTVYLIIEFAFGGKVDGNYVTSSYELTSSEEQFPDNPVDFSSLQAENPDIYAWINIPNTNVDYPVLQSPTDDYFYLTRNYKGETDANGAIYTEIKNNKDFSDPNTVLYGHNMRNDSMFASLHRFEDESFFNENKYIYVYTEHNILTYEIFSAYQYDNRHILNSFDFSDKNVFKEYLDFATNPQSIKKNVRKDLSVNENDKIITLSTCLGISTARYLVQGVLIDNVKTK